MKNTIEARKIIATNLDSLKIENPYQFVLFILICNGFVWLVDHPLEFYQYTGYEVNSLIEAIQGQAKLILNGVMSLSSVSTFKDLPDSHPKKVAAKGELEEPLETL